MFPARCRAPRAPARSARPGACHFPRPRSSRRIPAHERCRGRRQQPQQQDGPPQKTAELRPQAGALRHLRRAQAAQRQSLQALCLTRRNTERQVQRILALNVPEFQPRSRKGRSDTAPARRRSGGSERSRADSGSAGSSQDTSTQRIVPPISTRRCVMRRMRSPQPLTVSVPRCTAIQTRASVYPECPRDFRCRRLYCRAARPSGPCDTTSCGSVRRCARFFPRFIRSPGDILCSLSAFLSGSGNIFR